MRKIIITSLFLLSSWWLSGQAGHTPFFPSEEGKVWTYQHFDAEGELQNTSRHTIKSVQAISDSTWATSVSAVLLDLEGDSIVGHEYQVLSKNGVLFTNLLTLLGPQLTGSLLHMELGITGDPFVLPQNLIAGRNLPDARSELEASVKGAQGILQMDFNIKNRAIEASEDLRLGNRDYPTHKITFDLEVLVMVKKRYRIVQYWTKTGQRGLVRAEIYDRRGELEAYSVLAN
ncbi:MAG: hypothetical protein AAF798_14285 [Bacteroidota bacterium]